MTILSKLERFISMQIKIDSTFDSKYYAKKIWEALFRETKANEWKSLYDFLCDLDCFERFMDDWDSKKPLALYWSYDRSGWTELKTYYDSFNKNIYKITIEIGTITIEKYNG